MPKTPGLPAWVTWFALTVFFVGSVNGLAALAGWNGDPALSPAVGGRMLGVAMIAGLAVFTRSRHIYLAAFMAGVAASIGDVLTEAARPVPTLANGGIALAFLGIGLLALMTTIRAGRREDRREA